MKRVVGYVGRRGAVYLLLVLAVLLFDNRAEIAATVQRIRDPQAHGAALAEMAAEIGAARDLARTGALTEIEAAHARATIDLAARRAARDAYRRQHAGLLARLNPLAALDPRAGRLALQVEAAERKEAVLGAARSAARGEADARTRLAEVPDRAVRAAAEQCNASAAKVAEFDRTPRIGQVWQAWTQRDRAELLRANREACADWRARRDARGKAADALATAQAARGAAADMADKGLQALRAQWRAEAERSVRARLGRIWSEWNMPGVLWRAAGWLLLIILSPYLIRALFFYVVAPLAGNARRIRLALPGGAGAALPLPGPSTISVPVRIGDGEELLVRSGFLQTSSVGGAKDTVLLLDWRRPLSSWITGLANLTRVRGEGQVTALSAIADPFAELTELALPEGAAVVLQPRALVAVVQPRGRPLRITTHWRLLSLNAWLTLQLRYFAFHGPARLVIRGGRGVRVERVEAGRIFGQDQLVGFSGDLAYSVTRNETFLPYLIGREPLLRDRVDRGDGVLIIEEAPLSLRGHARPRNGLEGAFDALLKAFGL